jgi:hypothetical protein
MLSAWSPKERKQSSVRCWTTGPHHRVLDRYMVGATVKLAGHTSATCACLVDKAIATGLLQAAQPLQSNLVISEESVKYFGRIGHEMNEQALVSV